MIKAHTTCAYLEFHITPLASPAGPLDCKNGISIGILDRELGIDEGELLLDPANSCAWGRLYFHFLETAETAPIIAAKGPHKVDHLQWEP